MSRRAFTLVEILVVIGLIAILSAILFPVFAQVRKNARSVACVSNFRQIGLAISMYAGDFDDHYPNGTDDGRVISCGKPFYSQESDLKTLKKSIYSLLKSYTSNNSYIWRCPQDTGIARGGVCYDANNTIIESNTVENKSLFQGRGNSYFYRVELGYRGIQYPASGYNSARPRTEIGSAKTGILIDAGPFWHGDQEFQGERQNVLFADGHVKTETSTITAWLWPLTENEIVAD
jgi:prepilin-type N-terminal cleavage/methylation domain-containing protein/prepilin-type processing-associated H-X9-DG protein